MTQKLTFRPTDGELIFLEDNEISWTVLCRWAIAKKKDEIEGVVKMDKRNRLRAMSMDLMIFFFGVICFGLSYVVINIIVFFALNIAALICMSAGMLLLIKEWRASKEDED